LSFIGYFLDTSGIIAPMTTYRDLISHQKRKANLQAFGGMLVFMAGGFLTQWHKGFLVLSLIGFVLSVIGILALITRVRCPACGAQLGYATLTPGGPFSVSDKFRYCPQCGVSLDTACPEEPD
jgi:hypothetical protein